MAEKILVINDDQSICELLTIFLRDRGYEVSVAYDGQAGLEKIRVFFPDLILLDIVMPKVDGYEVCAQLKSDPSIQDIPVIFLSSLNESKDRIKGLDLGGVDFINKVTDRGELLARVQTHLRIRMLNKELNTRNQELIIKQKRLEDDLAAAAVIQQSLLPQMRTELNKMDIAWRCRPCEQVGGDIFNVIRVDDHHIIFYMIDVSGHGVPSAMVTVSVSQQLNLLNSFLKSNEKHTILSPKEIMKALDQEFPLEKFNKFFTIFYMVLNTQDNSITYSNAGHPPGIILHQDGEMELLNRGGTVIGMNQAYEEERKELRKGDKIILYTDGVTEYQNSKTEFYTSKRFYHLLENKKREPVSNIVDAVNQELLSFGEGVAPRDDVSILGVEYQASTL